MYIFILTSKPLKCIRVPIAVNWNIKCKIIIQDVKILRIINCKNKKELPRGVFVYL